MTTRDFCFWLQGFFEITGATELNAEQAKMVRDHLQLVFKHEIGDAVAHEAHPAEAPTKPGFDMEAFRRALREAQAQPFGGSISPLPYPFQVYC